MQTACVPLDQGTMPFMGSGSQVPFPALRSNGTTWCPLIPQYSSTKNVDRKKWGYCACDAPTSPPTDSSSGFPPPNVVCGPKSVSPTCAFVPTRDACSAATTLAQAEAMCAAAAPHASNARLCSVAELTSGQARSLCKRGPQEKALVWTRDTCTLPGSSQLGNGRRAIAANGKDKPLCLDPTSPTTPVRGVRCCVTAPGTDPTPGDNAGGLRNVLLITMDDMRPDTNVAFNRKRARTPNLDRFARSARTVTFAQAYATYPVCSPSRTSFLSGLFPDTTGVYGHGNPVPTTLVTIPDAFKAAGYLTVGGGKVFHPGQDSPAHWDAYYFPNANPYRWNGGCGQPGATPLVTPLNRLQVGQGQICVFSGDVTSLIDFQLASAAMQAMDRLTAARKPFFLAVGFFAPHLPYIVHQKFWEPVAAIFDPANDAEHPAGPTPQASITPWLAVDFTASLGAKLGGNPTPWTYASVDQQWRLGARAAYMAAIAQADAAVGMVLDHLEASRLADNTVVVVMGDHGFSVGEQGFWNKNVLYELATRLPLMVRVPSSGAASVSTPMALPLRSPRIVDSLSVFPTVLALAGLGAKAKQLKLPGEDLSQHISDVLAGTYDATKDASNLAARMAVSQVVRCGVNVDCFPQSEWDYSSADPNATPPPLPLVTAVGYSVRTSTWRYTVYLATNGPLGGKSVAWNASNVLSEELYSHANDVDTELALTRSSGATFDVEFTNVAAQRRDVATKLFAVLKARFGGGRA